MTTLFKLITLLIVLVILNCSREEVLSSAEKPIEQPQSTIEVTDTVSCAQADTTPKRYPISFTVTVEDWK
jgi:hypothetical protein